MGWWGVKIKMKIVASARQNATATAPCVVVRERTPRFLCLCVVGRFASFLSRREFVSRSLSRR